MKMREELLALIEKSDYKGMNVEQLSHTLHKEEHALFVEMMKELNALEIKGSVIFSVNNWAMW